TSIFSHPVYLFLRKFSLQDSRGGSDHPAREFCVQYGESDLAFLARLWAEEGIFFFERFAADSPEQKLTLCDDVAGLS
ncbi:contractile injection system protein, VgrG/Pvc8 family, partial [Escherichia coli]|nr:contractile injection system protein, VgrG/Pvc8 family [Escherichia coli]